MSQLPLKTIVAWVKRNSIFIVLILLVLIVLGSYLYIESTYDIWREDLGYDFSRKDGIVYYDKGSYFKEMYGVDVATFRPINDTYSRDKDKLYKHNIYDSLDEIVNIDINTAEILSGGFLKDKKGLCFDEDENKSCGVTYLSGINSSSFSILNTGVIKDDKYVYRVRKQEGNFECIQDMNYLIFSDDSVNYYEVIKNKSKYAIKSTEFKQLQGNYYSYSGRVLYLTRDSYWYLSGSAVTDFKMIDDNYVMSNGNMYFRGMKIKKTDPGSLLLLGGGYAKDNDNVYYLSKEFVHYYPSFVLDTYVNILENVNVGSFDYKDGIGYDGKKTFFDGSPIYNSRYDSEKNISNIKLVLFSTGDDQYELDDSQYAYANDFLYYLVDQGGTYYLKTVKKVNQTDFSIINEEFAFIQEEMYYRGLLVSGSFDIHSMNNIDGSRWQDGAFIYRHNKDLNAFIKMFPLTKDYQYIIQVNIDDDQYGDCLRIGDSTWCNVDLYGVALPKTKEIKNNQISSNV